MKKRIRQVASKKPRSLRSSAYRPKNSFLALILLIVAVVGLLVYLVISRSPAKVPKAAVGTNTVDLILSDNTGASEGCVKGAQGYDWASGAVYRGIKLNGSLMDTWAMLEWDCNHDSGSSGVQIEVQNFQSWALANGRWVQVQDHIYGSQINDPNFGPTIYGDAGSGPLFTVPHNRGVQFYGPQTSIPAGTGGFWSAYQARLVNNDGLAYLMANVGGDYWDPGIVYKGDMGISRLKRLTGDWQWFNFTNVPETTLRSNPPPGLSISVPSPTPTPQSTQPPLLVPTPTPTPNPASPTPVPSPSPTSSPAAGVFSASYFNNQTLSGAAIISQIVPAINFNWGSGSPAPEVPSNHFSARYTGIFKFDGAKMRFNATADDGVRVFVDGKLLIDGWRDQAATTYNAILTPPSGNHTVTVEYYENLGQALLQSNFVHAATCYDMTGDGKVTDADLNVAAVHFNMRGAAAAAWDVDGNGSVNSTDLLRISLKKGTSCQ